MVETAKDNSGNHFSANAIFAESNRGILFDILVFLANIFLMQMLTKYFIELTKEASAGDQFALYACFALCIAVFVLPPLGAILKRPHFHRRMKIQGVKVRDGSSYITSCLFNPIFYFTLNLLIVSALLTFITHFVFAGKEPGQGIFMFLIVGGMAFTLVHTVLVYRYFTPPKREPKTAFFRSPLSELAGDICILVNMLIFQLAWNIEVMPFGPIAGVEDFLGRLFLLVFVALLIYFPPRMLFLAEDIKRPAAWASILLANSPVIARVLFGSAAW